MIGQVIGNYEIEREIGHGGMGTVYLARHKLLGRLAAIKVLLPELSANEDMVSRIFNEARLCALIHHPGIVDVYEFGKLESSSAYLIMEYLEGETLGERIDRDGPLPIDLAVTLGRQIAQAVGAAHQKDIVHRDLKPDNVYLVPDEEVACGLRARILDFGIAKLQGGLAGSTHRTRTGNLMGTPIYMSPEQCRGTGMVDWRSDIYSLGCILFEMVTGRVPFDHEGTGEIIAAHLYSEPSRPSEIAPAVPAWLDDVILMTLAKKVEGRPQTMEELAGLLGGRPRSVPAIAKPAEPARPRQSTTFRSSVGEMAPPPLDGRRRRRRALGAAAAVIALGGLGLLLMVGGSHEPRPAPSPPAAHPAAPAAVPMPVYVPAPAAAPAVAPAPAAPDAGVAAAPGVEEAPAVAPEPEPAAGKPHRHRPKKPPRPGETPHPETLDPFGE